MQTYSKSKTPTHHRPSKSSLSQNTGNAISARKQAGQGYSPRSPGSLPHSRAGQGGPGSGARHRGAGERLRARPGPPRAPRAGRSCPRRAGQARGRHGSRTTPPGTGERSPWGCGAAPPAHPRPPGSRSAAAASPGSAHARRRRAWRRLLRPRLPQRPAQEESAPAGRGNGPDGNGPDGNGPAPTAPAPSGTAPPARRRFRTAAPPARPTGTAPRVPAPPASPSSARLSPHRPADSARVLALSGDCSTRNDSLSQPHKRGSARHPTARPGGRHGTLKPLCIFIHPEKGSGCRRHSSAQNGHYRRCPVAIGYPKPEKLGKSPVIQRQKLTCITCGNQLRTAKRILQANVYFLRS